MSEAADKLAEQFSTDLNHALAQYFERMRPVDHAFIIGEISEPECEAKREQISADYSRRVDELRLAYDKAWWRTMSDMRKGR